MVADADMAEAAQAGRSPCSPDVTGQPNDGQTSARTDAPIGFPACRALEVTRRAGFSAAGALRRAKYTAGLALVALLLIGCGGGEAPSLPSGTLSRSAGALPSLPSLTATLPGPTRSPPAGHAGRNRPAREPHSLGDASGATDAGHHHDRSARSRHDRPGGRGARIAGNVVAVGRGTNEQHAT